MLVYGLPSSKRVGDVSPSSRGKTLKAPYAFCGVPYGELPSEKRNQYPSRCKHMRGGNGHSLEGSRLQCHCRLVPVRLVVHFLRSWDFLGGLIFSAVEVKHNDAHLPSVIYISIIYFALYLGLEENSTLNCAVPGITEAYTTPRYAEHSPFQTCPHRGTL
jgi:hypothetical protein